MNFEKYESFEKQEKEPKTVEDWIKYLDPSIKVKLVDEIRRDGKTIPATYCFDGDDPKARDNERIEIGINSNEINESPINVASHELRHRKQRNFEAREERLEMLNAEQVKAFLKEFSLNADYVDGLISDVEDSPREIDAIFFSFFVENGIKLKVISKEDIPDLLDMNSVQIINFLKSRFGSSEYNRTK